MNKTDHETEENIHAVQMMQEIKQKISSHYSRANTHEIQTILNLLYAQTQLKKQMLELVGK